jgi:hypothetical protein
VTCTLPTVVLAGQASAWNAPDEHFGVAFGLPSSPLGRRTVTSRTSSSAGEREKPVEIRTSGCPPAWVVLGVTLKSVMDTAARAAPGSARAQTAAPSTMRTAVRRARGTGAV